MPATVTSDTVRCGGSTSPDPVEAVRELHQAIQQERPALVLFFCSPQYDLEVVAREMKAAFGDAPVVGCTSAGEIGPFGYQAGALTGLSLGEDEFVVGQALIHDLASYQAARGQSLARKMLEDVAERGVCPTAENTFALLLIDGLSVREESVVSSVYPSIAPLNLVGGSAGDDLNFGTTLVYADGQFHENSAVLLAVQTERPFEVFRAQHFAGTDKKMVITEADPLKRTVTEINGEPAVREYARVIGMEIGELTPMIFASNPVLLRVGGTDYLRSIAKVNEDESLQFFCAINEGDVLTVAHAEDLREHIESTLAARSDCDAVIAFDCILRSLELDQKDMREPASSYLQGGNVVGFSTYGEQFNAMHVNQTMTGVFLYRPGVTRPNAS